MRPYTFPGLVLLGISLPAQTLEEARQTLRDSARSARYASFAATLAGLAHESELSGGRFSIDDSTDTSLTVIALPFARDLALEDETVFARLEAGLGYTSASFDAPDLFPGSPLETSVDSDFESFGGFVGAGPGFDLGDWRLSVTGVVGVSHLRNDTDYAGADAAAVRQLTDGVLFTWDATYLLYGTGVLLRYRGIEVGDVHVSPHVRYDLRRSHPLDTDDPAQDAPATVQWFSLRLGFDGPTGLRIDDRLLRWVGDLGYKNLVEKEDLGFRDYFEVGLGLRWESGDAVPGVSSMTLSGAFFYGEDVEGWTIGLTATF